MAISVKAEAHVVILEHDSQIRYGHVHIRHTQIDGQTTKILI